jgi:hypothetical protein
MLRWGIAQPCPQSSCGKDACRQDQSRTSETARFWDLVCDLVFPYTPIASVSPEPPLRRRRIFRYGGERCLGEGEICRVNCFAAAMPCLALRRGVTSLLPDKTSGETHVHVSRFRLGQRYCFLAARMRRKRSPNCSSVTFFAGSSVFTRCTTTRFRAGMTAIKWPPAPQAEKLSSGNSTLG